MNQNIQLVVGGFSLLVMVIVIIVFRNHVKRRRNQLGVVERIINEAEGEKDQVIQIEKEKTPEPEIVMDKTVILKRPGPKVNIYASNSSLIKFYMGRAKIPYTKAKMVKIQYIDLKNQPGRKKAKGYWEFTIQYAA